MKSTIVFLAGFGLLLALPFDGAEWLGRVLITVGMAAMAIGYFIQTSYKR